MLPFKLTPAVKSYLWGGTRLKERFHVQSPEETAAECWSLSAHPDGDAVVAGGPMAGMPFSRFVREHPEALGTRYPAGEAFPVLIKLIDAKRDLSIQVHPDDGYARRVEGSAGKTEMWYILDCEPGAFLYFGFRPEVAPDRAREGIRTGELAALLQRIYVKPGDLVFIPAGTVHAIGAGILLAEVQQSSNVTYRVCDFGRLGPDGKPRQLHTRQALEVANLGPGDAAAPGAAAPVRREGALVRRLAACAYFCAGSVKLSGRSALPLDGGSFLSVLCLDGAQTLSCGGQALALAPGDSVFVPADCKDAALEGEGELLLTGLGR